MRCTKIKSCIVSDMHTRPRKSIPCLLHTYHVWLFSSLTIVFCCWLFRVSNLLYLKYSLHMITMTCEIQCQQFVTLIWRPISKSGITVYHSQKNYVFRYDSCICIYCKISIEWRQPYNMENNLAKRSNERDHRPFFIFKAENPLCDRRIN